MHHGIHLPRSSSVHSKVREVRSCKAWHDLVASNSDHKHKVEIFHFLLKYCTGSVWDGNNFVHSSHSCYEQPHMHSHIWCCGLVVLKQWTHTQVLAVAEQCLHAVQAVFFPNSVSLASRLRVSKKLEGDTADPNWPEVYYIPCSAVLSNKNWGKGDFEEVVAIAWRLAGHWSGSGKWVIALASLFFFSESLFHSLIKLSLSRPTSVLTFVLFLIAPGGEWVGSCVVLSWRLGQPTVLTWKVVSVFQNIIRTNFKRNLLIVRQQISLWKLNK